MTTLSPKRSRDQPELDHRPGVVKAALLAASSSVTALGTLLAVAGQWQTPDETTRLAITVGGIVTALALGIAAVYIWPRK